MTATLRDGETTIDIGDEVETDFHKNCLGRIFVVEEVNPYANCESGFMIVVHLKGHPDRKMKGSLGIGIDANWFKIVKKQN